MFALCFSVYSVTSQEETQHIIKLTGHKNDYDRHKIKKTKQNRLFNKQIKKKNKGDEFKFSLFLMGDEF